MSALDIPEVKELLEEWKKEALQLAPIDSDGTILNNNLNRPRFELERKYKRLIKEAIEKHSGTAEQGDQNVEK